MLMLTGGTQYEQRHGIAIPRLLTFLGDASYSIYLVHMPALSVFAKVAMVTHLNEHVPHAILYILLASGSIVVGCVFHLCVEKPLLARSTKRLELSPAAPAPPASLAA